MKRGLFAVLALTLLVPSWAGAVSKQYTAPGTAVIFADSAQTPTVTWTLSNKANGVGQVSARYDKGAGSQPALWEMRCRFSFTGTNVVGTTLELYVATSDGTNPDGEVGTSDASMSSDKRRNLLFVGVLVVDQTTTNTVMTASFRNIYLPQRYFSLAMWNNTGLPTQTSTSAHRCTMTPVPFEMQ